MTTRDPKGAVATPMSDRAWLRRWIVIVAAGEAVGFAVPAMVGALTADSPAFVPLLLAAGAVEGIALGAAQAFVLRERMPRLRRAVWVGLTAAAAVVAYAVGLVPSTFAVVWSRWAWPAQAILFTLLAIVLLGSIGVAQWIELRHHLRGAGWWILATAGAWLAGLGVFFAIAPPLWHEGLDFGVIVLIGIIAGVAMAITMAAVTGLAMAALLRRAARGRPLTR